MNKDDIDPWNPQTGNAKADEMIKKAWQYRQMADDLRGQAFQLLHPVKQNKVKEPQAAE